MNNIFEEKVKMARKVFCIQDFPGDLFTHITKSEEYIDRFKLIIFKEDLHKLHGFIAYEGDYTYVGINHKRPIYVQNLTLGHELGHRFLHEGMFYSDDKKSVEIGASKNTEESEAFEFGRELLYPKSLFHEDDEYINKNSLLNPSQAKRLGLFINELCHKYYLSFETVLRWHLYKNYKVNLYYQYIDSINDALGTKYTNLDTNFYIAKDSTYDKPSDAPYIHLHHLVKEAIEKNIISKATGEAILFPYFNQEGE
ncbi:protein of unknown function [Sporobacter termitidis DSM 10068]|uniref:Uncharacterized protein n=1 Tax=Sporobacter termitidis DSM 10068 TaxID=1123282 RepID=A0A1M5ZIQ1_9FIRM|nr:ImmA/IrrE family metallo-endopeptidase [Sporobacter termitidis]SHI24092.1 protein of unknown function [Sporobacter termitidis DSM 10068]